jgi:hypothetical protein
MAQTFNIGIRTGKCPRCGSVQTLDKQGLIQKHLTHAREWCCQCVRIPPMLSYSVYETKHCPWLGMYPWLVLDVSYKGVQQSVNMWATKREAQKEVARLNKLVRVEEL